MSPTSAAMSPVVGARTPNTSTASQTEGEAVTFDESDMHTLIQILQEYADTPSRHNSQFVDVLGEEINQHNDD